MSRSPGTWEVETGEWVFKVMSKVSLGYFVLEERKDERGKGKGKGKNLRTLKQSPAYLEEHNLKMAKN